MMAVAVIAVVVLCWFVYEIGWGAGYTKSQKILINRVLTVTEDANTIRVEVDAQFLVELKRLLDEETTFSASPRQLWRKSRYGSHNG